MTPEPTPLVTVLPCEAEKARDILQRERGSALWLNDDEVIRAMVRFAHEARLAALEEGREQAAGLAEIGDWDSWEALATAIRSLSQPVEGSAGASVGPGYSAEPEPEVSAHVMRPSSLNHGNAQCVHCHASDLEIALVLGPVCPNAPQGDAQTPAASNKGGRDGE